MPLPNFQRLGRGSSVRIDKGGSLRQSGAKGLSFAMQSI